MVSLMEVSFEFGSCLEIAWSMEMHLLRYSSSMRSAGHRTPGQFEFALFVGEDLNSL